MTLETLEFQTGPDPVATLVVLHGLGADGNDFVPIAHQLDLRSVGHVRYVFPHAPVRPVTINGGYRMRAWYDILGSELDRVEDEAGLRASRLDLDALLASEAARGVPASRTVLMGFSQGCAMTLMTGLRASERLAGLVGLSGYLPLAATTAAEATDANRLTPIFMGHGRFDGVVPQDRGAATRDRLKQMGYDVEWHEYPIQHSVCEEEIEDVNRFLVKVLRPV
jgi:phospholipase/carboxylesterase